MNYACHKNVWCANERVGAGNIPGACPRPHGYQRENYSALSADSSPSPSNTLSPLNTDWYYYSLVSDYRSAPLNNTSQNPPASYGGGGGKIVNENDASGVELMPTKYTKDPVTYEEESIPYPGVARAAANTTFSFENGSMLAWKLKIGRAHV